MLFAADVRRRNRNPTSEAHSLASRCLSVHDQALACEGACALLFSSTVKRSNLGALIITYTVVGFLIMIII